MDTDNESQQTYVESPRHEKLRLERLFEQMPDNITQPYINFIVSSLPLELQFQHGLQKRLKPILQRSTYGSEMPKRFQTETDQAALLSTLPGKFETEKVKRGKKVKEVSMESVAAVLGEHRVFAQTIRRVKSLHAVLSLMGQHNGYDKIQLIALLTNSDEAMVVDILLTQSLLVDDWRRQFRPSAAEVAALENELEILFIREKSIEGDEEVVLITDDGTGTWVPVRDLMLY
ncbi:hypothetical protein KC357_g9155 [Hortaea werneckii]|nr:hypothetical protein KC357_g9155 [Hortaea werneckii]